MVSRSVIPQYAYAFDHIENRATEPVAEKENADAPNSLNLFYAFDGNKNVSDVFYRMTSNGIGAHYDYAPFGVELPDLSGGYQWGVVGGEITLGAKGTFWAVLYEGESISI